MLRQDSSALCALFPDCSQCARQPHDESFCDLCDDRASPGWDGTAAHGTSRCLAHDARDGARLSSVHLVVAPSPFSHKPEGFSLPPQCPGPGMNTPLFVIDSESVLQLVGEACGTWWHAAVAISLGHHNGHRLWVLSGATAAAASAPAAGPLLFLFLCVWDCLSKCACLNFTYCRWYSFCAGSADLSPNIYGCALHPPCRSHPPRPLG